MFYNDFKGLKLSALGFGTMRLPLLPDGKTVDSELTAKMIDTAIRGGVNYFDTAVPYHGGASERIVGEILNRYPRESWYLADKYPGHQHYPVFNPAETFERQLKRCGVDYFDFYLYHNICENDIADYMDPRWGILDYFVEQRKAGRIRHLGMSVHASLPLFRELLDGPYGQVIEFCQIQLNYLDWTLQDAREKVRLLNERGIPIWVMEPVRGGKLAAVPEVSVDEAFRWVSNVPGVTVTLSGMSAMEHVEGNLKSFAERRPLTAADETRIFAVAETLKKGVPCTACRYCCDGCPVGLDIPALLHSYNEMLSGSTLGPTMYVESLPEELRPSACVGCGQCASVCPQNIGIPAALSDFADRFAAAPKWADICRERQALEAAAAAADVTASRR